MGKKSRLKAERRQPAPPPGPRTLWQDLRWGISTGLFFGLFYSLYVLGLFLLRGDGPFEKQGVTLGRTILLYMLGGMTAGATAGLLRRHVHSRGDAVWLGMLAAVPVFALAASIRGGPAALGRPITWVMVGILSVLIGGMGGYTLWKPGRRA